MPKKRKKLKAVMPGRTPAQIIHARIAEQLPINAVVAPEIVEDPYQRGERITVLKSLRDDPLQALRSRGTIDQAQFDAGRAWQGDYEAAEIGGVRAFQIRDPVDGGGQYPELITDRRRNAIKRLAQADRVLGLFGCQIIRYVLVHRRSMTELAEDFNFSTGRDINFLSRRFRECLIPGDLLDRLVEMRSVLCSLFPRYLTLSSVDGWESTARFPFLIVGEDGVYNIAAGEGALGVEVRPIPGDDVRALVSELVLVARELGQEVGTETLEEGVECPADNPHLGRLLQAVAAVSGEPARVGRKKAASSARFAPGGNAVVWGQTGIGPHAPDERHFIPSIEPYLEVLDRFAELSMSSELAPGSRGST